MPYLAHFGLEEHPFTLTPDVDYFFPSQEHANIIASLEFALRRDTGIIKVVGEIGTGKTLLCRLLIKKLVDTEAVAYINAPRANQASIMRALCNEFGIEAAGDSDEAYALLNRFLVEEHAKGRLAVVVVDEAQHLGREGLEFIRLISNLETEKHKLLQIVLFGQTELDDLLSDPSMRQLNQRIAFSLNTKPLTIEESSAYINHRIAVSRRAGVEYDVFSGRAVDYLARACGGIPRVINIIADKSLLAAFADGAPVVQPSHVAEAVKESGALVGAAAPPRKTLMYFALRTAMYVGAALLLAALAIGIVAAFPDSKAGQTARALMRSVATETAAATAQQQASTAPLAPQAAPPIASVPVSAQAASNAQASVPAVMATASQPVSAAIAVQAKTSTPVSAEAVPAEKKVEASEPLSGVPVATASPPVADNASAPLGASERLSAVPAAAPAVAAIVPAAPVSAPQVLAVSAPISETQVVAEAPKTEPAPSAKKAVHTSKTSKAKVAAKKKAHPATAARSKAPAPETAAQPKSDSAIPAAGSSATPPAVTSSGLSGTAPDRASN